MENLEIRAFQDGNDFYICFKDINPSTKDFITSLLKPVMESESMLYAPEQASEDIMMPESIKGHKLYGLSVEEVLTKYGNKGYANIAYLKERGDFGDKTPDVAAILNQYLFDTLSGIDPERYAGDMNEEEADLWLQCFRTLINPNTKKAIKDATGFLSFEDFLKEGTLEQKTSLVYKVITDLGFHEHD